MTRNFVKSNYIRTYTYTYVGLHMGKTYGDNKETYFYTNGG